LWYAKKKHQLGPGEVKEFFQILESKPSLNESIQSFIRMWEVLFEMMPSLRTGMTLDYPNLKCVHCEVRIALRDEGESGEFLWLHQGNTRETMSLEPVTFCPLPYYLVQKIAEKHPEWIPKIRSVCKICHEELTFPTNHHCLVPEWFRSP